MPLSPSWRAMRLSNCRFHSRFISTDSLMFGRSKPRMKGSTRPPNSRSAMSSRVTSSAVAVSAAIGTSGKRSPQPAQVLVFRPEGRPPLGDAMRLVDDEQRHRQPGQRRQHRIGHQPFRRHVEKTVSPTAARRQAAMLSPRSLAELMLSAATPASRKAATCPASARSAATPRQRVLHDQGRDLKAQRLARSPSASP